MDALAKDTDPDRMKGALYLLSSKGPASYAITDGQYAKRFIEVLLQCQHQEKVSLWTRMVLTYDKLSKQPSIQKLVTHTIMETTGSLTSEILSTHILTMDLPTVDVAVAEVQNEFGLPDDQLDLLEKALRTLPNRVKQKEAAYLTNVSSILEVANAPATHVRFCTNNLS